MKKIFSLVVLLLLFLSQLVAQDASSLPKVTYSGQEYYIYTAANDETLYGVAKRYGWDVDRLTEANPGVDAVLKNKQKLFYPVGVTGDAFPAEGIQHKEEKGETVFGLARKYGVPVDAIYAANPSAQYGIKTGEILVIKPAENTPEVSAVPVPAPVASNPELKIQNTPEPQPEVTTPAPLPVHAQEVKEKEIEEEVELVAEDTVALPERVRMTVLLAQDNTKRDVDFVRGILTALKRKTDDWKVDLKVLPAQPEKIASMIAEKNIPESDVIITTYDKNFPAELALYCDENKVPLVNVFDLKSDFYRSRSGFLQMLPPSDEFNDMIVENILSRFEDRMFIFIGADKSDAIGGLLEEKVAPVDKVSIASVSELDGVEITENSRIAIYCFDSARKDVTQSLEKIISVRDENPLADISVIGRPNWVVFDDTMSDKFQQADTYIPSRFYYNPKGLDEKRFAEDFQTLTGFAPVRSFPLYAAMGYDIANYFIPAVTEGRVYDSSASRFVPLQLDIRLVDEPDGGYINNVAYLLRFTPYGTIEKILSK